MEKSLLKLAEVSDVQTISHSAGEVVSCATGRVELKRLRSGCHQVTVTSVMVLEPSAADKNQTFDGK